MPMIIRAAGKRFAAPRPAPSEDPSTSYSRASYFDDIEHEMRHHEQRKSAPEVLREYAEFSTSHALPHTVFAYTTPFKLAWLVVFLVTVVGAVIATVIEARASRDDVTSDVHVRSGPLRFPAVTVCNLNPLRSSRASLGGANFVTAMNVLGDRLGEANRLETEPKVGSVTYDATASALVSRLKETLDNATLRAMGHQRDDFIVSCQFLGFNCNVKRDFKVILDEMYGNCFVFNNNATSHRITALAGSHLGLQLWLNVETWEYVPWLTGAAGAVVTVHDPGTYPAPADQGVTLLPGWQTDVAVTLRNVSRKGNVNPCSENTRFEEKYGYKYTPHACQALCLQDHLVERCGCGDAKRPVPKGSAPCQLTDREQLMCMYRTISDFEAQNQTCRCPQPCSEAHYDPRVSRTHWPAPSFETTVRNFLYGRDSSMFFKIDSNGIRNSLLKVNVYFPSLTFYDTTEDIPKKRVRVLAKVGMHWAAWSGFSIMTWLEILVLIVTLGIVLCSTAPGVM